MIIVWAQGPYEPFSAFQSIWNFVASAGEEIISVAQKGGLSLTRRQMRELERQQLEALIRDDDELAALLSRFL